jgi:hypothetical protein
MDSLNSLQGWLGAIGGLAVVVAYAAWVMHVRAKEKHSPPPPPLIDCPDCGGKVSRRALTCPHCGRPMTHGS